MRHFLLSCWIVLDPLYFHFTRLTYLDHQSRIFRVRLTTYKGKERLLNDGTLIKRNDTFIKLHLHNCRLIKEMQKIDGSVRRGKYLIEQVRESMPVLLSYINSHPRREQIKGAIGVTMLHQGATRLGFDVVKPTNPLYRFFKSLSHIPIFLLSNGHKPLTHLPDIYYLLISKEQLSKTYSDHFHTDTPK